MGQNTTPRPHPNIVQTPRVGCFWPRGAVFPPLLSDASTVNPRIGPKDILLVPPGPAGILPFVSGRQPVTLPSCVLSLTQNRRPFSSPMKFTAGHLPSSTSSGIAPIDLPILRPVYLRAGHEERLSETQPRALARCPDARFGRRRAQRIQDRRDLNHAHAGAVDEKRPGTQRGLAPDSLGTRPHQQRAAAATVARTIARRDLTLALQWYTRAADPAKAFAVPAPWLRRWSSAARFACKSRASRLHSESPIGPKAARLAPRLGGSSPQDVIDDLLHRPTNRIG